ERYDERARELVVDVRRECNLGFAETETALARRHFGIEQKSGEAILIRVLRETRIRALQHRRDGGIECGDPAARAGSRSGDGRRPEARSSGRRVWRIRARLGGFEPLFERLQPGFV